jgi:DNA-binding response OmpR family regulator
MPFDKLDVAVVRWPSEADRREECRIRGVPRLLIVEGRTAAPTCIDALEDWVRLPMDKEDARARARTLLARARLAGRPMVTRQNVLRMSDRSLPLSPLEASLLRQLAATYGEVVSRDDLAAVGWPTDVERGRKNLHLQILRLRRRIQPLGLVIRTVWGCGYLLDSSDRGA